MAGAKAKGRKAAEGAKVSGRRSRPAVELEAMLAEIGELSSRPAHDRARQREGLRKALGIAYGIHLKASAEPAWEKALRAAYKARGVRKAREGSNPFTRLAKLCFPGRKAGDYNRYAGVLRRAKDRGWDAVGLEEELAEAPNALAELSRRDARSNNPPPPQPSLHDRGTETIRAKAPLGEFRVNASRKAGLVLLIGEVGQDGKGEVRHVVRGQEVVLRRLVVSVGRAAKKAGPGRKGPPKRGGGKLAAAAAGRQLGRP